MNYYLVTFGIVTDRQTDRQTDRRTDRKRRIRAQRALAHVGSKVDGALGMSSWRNRCVPSLPDNAVCHGVFTALAKPSPNIDHFVAST